VPRKETITLLAEALALTPSERALLEAAARPGGLTASSTAARVASLSPSDSPSWPLVGRAQELLVLERHLDNEGPPVLLLAGEPGIGKSRLLREGKQFASRRGWTVLEGGCQRRSGQEPYAPLVGALEGYLHRASSAFARASLEGCAWLVRLLPELVETTLVPAPSWTLPSQQERRLMFASVDRFLANVAGSAGTLLVLDDLQWAGTDALDLLTTLVRSAGLAPVRVVGAYRTTELPQEAPLRTALGDLASAGLAAQHLLGPLAPQEARDLLTPLLEEGERYDIERTEQVLARVGGVPFFLVSYAHALRAGSGEGKVTQAVPWSVTESIRQRMAVLSPAAQHLLGAAAVGGRRVEREVLMAAWSQPELREEEALEVLEDLDQAHLLREEDGTFQFTHDLIWEVVLAELSTLRRQLWHRRFAQALEQVHARALDRVSGQIATHYDQAGLPDQAVAYYERAARMAGQMYANAEAIAAYRRALTLLKAAPRTSTEQVQLWQRLAPLYAGLGDRLGMTGAFEEARQVYQEALTQVPEQNHIWQARLHRWIGGNWWNALHDAEPAFAAYDLAERTLGEAPPGPALEWWQEWIDLQLVRMGLQYRRATVTEMQALIEQTRPVLERAGTLAQRAGFHFNAFLLNMRLERFVVSENTLKHVRAMLAAWQEAGDQPGIALAHFNLGFGSLWHGNLDEAEVHLRAALAWAELSGHASQRSQCLAYLTILARKRGEVEVTTQYGTQALEAARTLEEQMYIASAEANLAWVAWRKGDLTEAERLGHAALAYWQTQERTYPFHWLALWPLLGIDLATGDLAGAIEDARRLLDPLLQPPPEALKTPVEVAIAAWDQHQPETAHTELRYVARLAEALGYL
jgi:tetratricopeptide (TPR) repeat protein